ADDGARREHRLDLRHWLSGLDRRCAAIRESCRRGEVRPARRRAREEVRASLRAAEDPAGCGSERRTARLTAGYFLSTSTFPATEIATPANVSACQLKPSKIDEITSATIGTITPT